MKSKTYLPLPIASAEYDQSSEQIFRNTAQINFQDVASDINDLGVHNQKDASLSLRKFIFLGGCDTTPSVGMFHTLTIGGTTTVASILDEDDMASDSPTALATQQSIKAYVQAAVTAEDLDFAGDTGTGAVDLDSQVFTVAGTANEIETSASGQTLTVGLPDNVTITTALSVDTINEKTLDAGVTIDSVLLKDDVVNATDVETGTISANDGVQSAVIANTTGVMTIASSVLTTTDINGGTVDGTTIGGATPAAGTFTTVTANTSLTIAATTTVSSILDEDNMVSDSATALATQQSIKAYVDSQVTAQDLDFAGDTGTGAVDLDSQVFTVAGTANEIETSASGQTITIGLPSNVTIATALSVDTINEKTLNAGVTIDSVLLKDDVVNATDIEVATISANDGVQSAVIANTTGVMTIASSVLTTADINGGTADGVVIGGTTPAAGTFTALTANTNLTIAGTTTVSSILDEDNMVSDSATALATQQSIKAYVDSQVTAQDLDFAGDTGTGAVDLDSQVFTVAGTANEVETSASGQTLTIGLPSNVTITTALSVDTINEKTLAAGVTIDSVLLKDDVVNATDIEVATISANDGVQSAVIANITGVMTIASSVLTTTDINGGTVDGAVVGGASPAAGTFTTLTANTNLTIAGTTTISSILDEDNMVSDSATALATQQSIKAYVDSQVTAQDLDFAGDSGTGAVDLDTQVFTIAGTANEIETSASGQTITVGLPTNVTVAGDLTVQDQLLVTGAGPHGIGTTSANNLQVLQGGSFTSTSGTAASAYRMNTQLTGSSGNTTRLSYWEIGGAARINTPDAAITITDVASMFLAEPAIVKGATDTITNASTLKINSAPTEATNNYALWVNSGQVRFDNNVGIGSTSPSSPLSVEDADNQLADFYSTDASAYIRIRDNSDSAYVSSDTGIGSFGGFSSANALNLNIDLVTGNVGLGTTDPGSYNGTGDNLVIWGSSPGMTIGSSDGVGGAGTYATIIFADGLTGTDLYTGYMRYFFDLEEFRIYANAAKQLTVSTSGTTLEGWMRTPDGSVGAPSYSFTNDTDTGMYLAAVADLRFAVAGGDKLRITASETTVSDQLNVELSGGSSRFLQLTRTDLVNLTWDLRIDGSGEFEIRSTTDTGTTVLNALQMVHATGDLTLKGWIRSEDGSTAAPTYSFTNGTDTGMFLDTVGRLAFSVGNTDTLMIQNNHASLFGPTAGHIQFLLDGAFTNSSTTTASAFRINTDITAASGTTGYISLMSVGSGGIGSGTITTQTAAETVTDVVSLYVGEPAIVLGAGSSVTNATTLKVIGAPTEGTNNRGLWVTAGISEFGGTVHIPDGTAGSPSLAFASDTDTGMYLSSTGTVAFSSGGAIKAYVGSNEMRVYHKIENADGTAGDPSYSFNSDTDTGMYLNAAGNLRFSVAGSDDLIISNNQVKLPGGTTLRLDSQSNSNLIAMDPAAVSGDYLRRITVNDGGGNWNFRSGHKYETAAERYVETGDGAVHVEINTDATGGLFKVKTAPTGTDGNAVTWDGGFYQSNTVFDVQENESTTWQVVNALGITRAGDGTASDPAYAFLSDTDTGMYLSAANSLSFTAGGALRVTIGSSGISYPSSGTGRTFIHTNESTRDKYRLYSSSTYAIGMQSNITFGGLSDWGMTFQFNNDSDRGFWWGDSVHTTAQGAMALTTHGYLTLARHLRLGYGEADTTAPTSTSALDISMDSGATLAIDINGLAVGDYILDWGGTGYTRMVKRTDQGGFSIGADSSIVILAGDKTDAYVTGAGIVAATTAENLHLAADGHLYFMPGQQSGYTTSVGWQMLNNGQLRAYDNGAAGTPAYSFVNDGDTGMRLSATGILRLSAGTDDAYFDVDSTNNRLYASRRIDVNPGSVAESIRIDSTSNTYMSWYISGNRHGYIQYVNSGHEFRFVQEESSTGFFSFYCGSVGQGTTRKFVIDGVDANEGRVYAENAQLYGGYLNLGTGTGAITIDFDRGNTHHLNNTGSRTITLAGAVNGTTAILTIEAGAGATSSWTWSTTIEWVGGTAPTLSTTSGVRDIVFLAYSDGVWLGSYTIGHA